ncbi:hypothetical protein H4J51_03320 [Colwellia sp. MB02u-18]|uniref:DUF3024 domain-containing protein n=1 Tax=unclassified Colwellia TaxID=196834 RepID=UPI0015F56FD9|nr:MULTISPECIES: hypothetical protein [unclassified Colwellia]MBA6224742.1 hypothetical protein [Colwellia sp. MB3u-45]MBA6266806.1 hypothetical protein [Colwellia sp. MB3u-43]MBA6321401.1 hypothetical protein [Colwellia sp. MB02u-19]MBA6323608.1 hypothetical protein [Colwellia sp. MB02u-18]MBA6332429.1 hypothetical protein [Colwellia sp. MB02u-12]
MKNWQISTSKTVKEKITNAMKNEVSKIACDLIDNTLKPKHIKPELNNPSFNKLVDIFIKWRGSSLYFYAKYKSCGEDAISPIFETKFARLVYAGEDKFNLSYMRHNEQWLNLHSNFTGLECCNAIEYEPYFVV